MRFLLVVAGPGPSPEAFATRIFYLMRAYARARAGSNPKAELIDTKTERLVRTNSSAWSACSRILILPAQRRLRHVQPRRPPEVKLLGERDETAELGKIEHARQGLVAAAGRGTIASRLPGSSAPAQDIECRLDDAHATETARCAG
jgi:hypothetical protein